MPQKKARPLWRAGPVGLPLRLRGLGLFGALHFLDPEPGGGQGRGLAAGLARLRLHLRLLEGGPLAVPDSPAQRGSTHREGGPGRKCPRGPRLSYSRNILKLLQLSSGHEPARRGRPGEGLPGRPLVRLRRPEGGPLAVRGGPAGNGGGPPAKQQGRAINGLPVNPLIYAV
jgi:hypothetical protein